MNAENIILEFDFKPKQSVGRVLIHVLIKFYFVVLLVILSSYQNPSLKVNSETKSILIDFQAYLKANLNSLVLSCDSDSSQTIKNQINNFVTSFYNQRDFQPAWTTEQETNTQLKYLTNLLDSAKYFGFPIDYFENEKIKQLTTEFTDTKSQNSRINLELTATYSALKLMIYLNKGIIERDTLTTDLSNYESLPEILNFALNQNNLRNEILSQQPELVQLQKIISSLPGFIDLQLSIKFTTPKFIDDKLLAKGLYYAGITETSEIDSTENNSVALFKLQELYHLPKDSNLNNVSHRTLISLLEYKYLQACLNLNRLRNIIHNDENYLFVNIPEFRLHVIESKQEKEIFNVIVGKEDTPTPILSSNIEKVVTNPYWTVPKSIVDNEMLKKIRKDSTYLERNGYYIINNREETIDVSTIDWSCSDPLGTRYFIRQKNSTSNALGLVKFIFPNEQSVYLHDTPSRGLFKQKNRTFSHGCIRLENPDKLAQYLTDKYYTENSLNIKKLIASNENNEINLTQKITIYIQYITCSGKENSDMEFYNDVYNLDKQNIVTMFTNQTNQ
ncbi:MAG: hypothetical protein A2041_00490 [Bacteroidetes bacterium GWA2_31_9b]|nr:MAG: hypothetical protein A2041_00490 [Bacteroidetes bacterium GWA2_31_9b]